MTFWPRGRWGLSGGKKIINFQIKNVFFPYKYIYYIYNLQNKEENSTRYLCLPWIFVLFEIIYLYFHYDLSFVPTFSRVFQLCFWAILTDLDIQEKKDNYSTNIDRKSLCTTEFFLCSRGFLKDYYLKRQIKQKSSAL